MIWLVFVGIAVGGIAGFLLSKMFGSQGQGAGADAGWSNREFDGTLLIIVISIAYLGVSIGTYFKPEFAKLDTTTQILQIAKDLLIFMAGYTFKNATGIVSEARGGNGK